MMAVDFAEKNFVFTKPEGWTDEQCYDLPVWKGMVPLDDQGNKASAIISCWKPNKEDIDAIVAGKPIYLLITGSVQPPVALMTENPFSTEQVNS